MSRCFASTHTMATTSGERTSVKRQASIYKTTANNASNSKYNLYDHLYNVNNGCLLSTSSYEGYLDIVKGKHIINPQLDGAPATKSQIWAGNFITIDLSGTTHSSVVTLDTSNNSIIYGISNEVIFPAITYNNTDPSGFGGGLQYPGWILDPSAASLINCPSNTSEPVYFEHFGKVSFRSSQEYWNAISNGDLLNGLQYPSKINFSLQPTNLSSTTALMYAPEPSYNSLDPSAQLARWCLQ